MSRPRKPEGEKLQQFSIRLCKADKARLDDVALFFGGSAKACEVAIRLLFASLTEDQEEAIVAIKKARGVAA